MAAKTQPRRAKKAPSPKESDESAAGEKVGLLPKTKVQVGDSTRESLTIAIPEKRVKALMENDFAVFKEIQLELGVKATLENGNVELEGDGGKCWIAEQVLNAISLGFTPARAYALFNDEYYLEVVDLDVLFGKNEKLIERYKARVIGSEGRAKKVLEDLSEAFISIWENKIAILGTFDTLSDAKEAILRLLKGSTHAGVYAYLEKKKKEEKRREILGSRA